jgi:hypothetical protein
MLVNYTLIFISMVLFAGLAVDAGLLERSYLQLQGGTQAAAAGAAIALQRGGSSSTITSAGQAGATLNGYTNGVNGVVVTIANPPTSGTYSGNAMAVSATITKGLPSSFLGVLGLGSVTMKSQAVVATPTRVSLTSAFNIHAIYTDGHSIPNNGGFDGTAFAFSANALGQVRASNNLGALESWRGNIFYFGTPNSQNGVSNATVSLPGGSYSQLLILASTAWGPAINAAFVVKYTDFTTTTATFSMSDWCAPQSYNGETNVSAQTYRDEEAYGATSPGPDYTPNYVYGYSMNLNSSKTVSSVKLPTNAGVVIFALDLKP